MFEKIQLEYINIYENILNSIEDRLLNIKIYSSSIEELEKQSIELRNKYKENSSELLEIKRSESLNELSKVLSMDINIFLDMFKENPLTNNAKLDHKKIAYFKNPNRIYHDISELALVHKTMFSPTNDRILSSMNSNVEILEKFGFLHKNYGIINYLVLEISNNFRKKYSSSG